MHAARPPQVRVANFGYAFLVVGGPTIVRRRLDSTARPRRIEEPELASFHRPTPPERGGAGEGRGESHRWGEIPATGAIAGQVEAPAAPAPDPRRPLSLAPAAPPPLGAARGREDLAPASPMPPSCRRRHWGHPAVEVAAAAFEPPLPSSRRRRLPRPDPATLRPDLARRGTERSGRRRAVGAIVEPLAPSSRRDGRESGWDREGEVERQQPTRRGRRGGRRPGGHGDDFAEKGFRDDEDGEEQGGGEEEKWLVTCGTH